MSRSLWFVAGAGAGVYAVTRARRAAEVLTADGLADRLAGLSVGLRLFRSEVRAGMAEKENDLRERLGLPLHGDDTTPELTGGRPADAGDGHGHPVTREGND
jgi:Family of unknown function (DUF6167)